MNKYTEMNPNPLVQYLNKPSSEFTKEDIIRYAEDHDVAMVNFRYCGWDGRLKTLNFVINSKQHLDSILSYGERVDGSSLFSFIEAGSSDLYVIPRYKTAFRNPFSEVPTLDILCSYYNKDGEPLASSPEYILKKAHQMLTERTGYTLDAMGELEYYIISEKDELFEATDQRGYHRGFQPFRTHIAQTYDNLRLAVAGQMQTEGGHLPEHRRADIHQIGVSVGSGADDRIGECDRVGLPPGDLFTKTRYETRLVGGAGPRRRGTHGEIGLFEATALFQ